jgi:hypothetical protein
MQNCTLRSVAMTEAPVKPQPHLEGKVRMLSPGKMHRAIDIFDLLYHLAPIALLIL